LLLSNAAFTATQTCKRATTQAATQAAFKCNLYRYYHWAPMCDINVTPVVDDVTARKILSSKPMYTKKD
jgi:hypothetical protein